MNILEPGGFTIMVVKARHIMYVPGHKTDKKDSAWICKLLRAGLLKDSFVPGREQRALRALTRYRRKLVQQQSAEHNRMIRIFEDANLKLSSVVSNIRGKTCTAVIDAVIAGETDPQKLSAMCTYWRLKSTREETPGQETHIVAIAAEILKVVYHMLKDGTKYRKVGPDYLDDRRK